MGRQIREGTDDLEAARAEIARNAAAVQTVPPRLRGLVVAVASAALRPDYRFNEERTEQQREKARAQVPPQMVPIPSGTVLLRPGDRVTRQHLDAFAALGLQNPRLDAATMAAISGLVVALVVLVAIYLALFHADLYHDMSRLLLLAILALVSVVGLKIGSNLLGLPISGFGYLGVMCVASAGMAIALLLSPAVATLIVGLLAVVSGLILHHELRFTVITLASSLVGIVSVATLRNRGDLVRATVLLCGANVVLNLLVGQIEGDTPRELGTGALWGIISGLFALVLFWIGVAVFEKPFGITTHLRLLELSDPATPILQAFRMRVPGTYAHSLMVGNLAHAAAEAIGANGLLVRVAAYYHDLGKMNRPEFFIENQGNAENVHDRLNPSLSALVLTSHVKEGLEMAAEVGLPPRVCDVIRQHHGTSLMKYFYFRATGGARDATLEAQFRYAGPKPQTKEAAILMLADSVEAASATLDKPTPQRIADFVARMIEDKRADGQLDECDLTLRDLRTIQDVFARTLCGTLHMRIEYPGSAASSTAGAAPTDLPPLAATASSSPIAMATFPEEALAGALTVVEGGTGTGGGTADPGPPAPPSSSSRKPEAITEALADGDDHPNGNNGGGGARPVSGGADAGGRHQAAR
jgi:putative nucleotidyltransferase with HDIG domain